MNTNPTVRMTVTMADLLVGTGGHHWQCVAGDGPLLHEAGVLRRLSLLLAVVSVLGEVGWGGV